MNTGVEGPPDGGHGGVCSRGGGACPAGMHPPLSSSQSPRNSVSACGENCARSLAPPLPTARSAAGAPFRSCPKRKRAVHGPKEKGAKRAPVQWPSARDGGRRIGASADFAWPSGTLCSSARSILPSRGGWFRRRRGGRRIELLLFSLPLAAPRGSWCNGPMRASAPTGMRKAVVLP